jgi:hypothetical protein
MSAMHPTDAADGIRTPARNNRTAQQIAVAAAAALVLGVVILIVSNGDVAAVWDQTFIAFRLRGRYPSFDEGIVSHLIAGVVNAVVPFDLTTSNTIMRALAALMYTGAAALLAWSVTGPQRLWGYFAFLLLLVSARFPFLWLSSELFAGTFLMLFLWSFVRGHHFTLTALFLVLFSLCKADLALPGLLVGAFLVLRPDRMPRWQRALILSALAAVLLVPTLFFARPYYAQFGGRSWVSFGQHYGELVQPHQLGEAPSGWGGWPQYLEQSFPGATSVGEAARTQPRRYIHFVFLSIAESGIRLMATKLLLLVPLAVFFFFGLQRQTRIAVLLLLTSIAPIVLFSFLHMRYQARFYPLALFIIFAGLRDGGYTRRHEYALAAVLALIAVWQLIDVVPILQTAYWLPD